MPVFGRFAADWNPWELLDGVTRFTGQLDLARFAGPQPTLSGDECSLYVEVALPGYEPDSLEVELEERLLRLKAERPQLELQDGQRWTHQERSVGVFERELELPYEIDAGGVEAAFKSGILSVRLPRAESAKPRKVNVALS